ncbi:MAG: DUF6809 family protein [Blautia sp.]
MVKNVLEHFYYEGLMPREICCPGRQEYRDALTLCETAEEELKEHLTPELAKLLEDYKSYMLRITTLENETHFVQGMALGIRMTSEAFLLEEPKTE